MFSKTSEYALRAVTTIAELGQDRPVLAKEIASKSKIPTKYLSKVLRDLVHVGILTSTRGIGGGFRLKRRANTLRLIDVVRPFEDVLASRRCPLGNARCSDENPCAMHTRWKPVKRSIEKLLERTTVAEVINRPK